MNWASMTLGDVALFSAIAAALAIWLYLRQPRAARLRVSTLRFWESAPSGSSSARRRKLREPLALLAQILFLVLIIAAMGNPRWEIRDGAPRRRVVTSPLCSMPEHGRRCEPAMACHGSTIFVRKRMLCYNGFLRMTASFFCGLIPTAHHCCHSRRIVAPYVPRLPVCNRQAR